MVVFSLLLLFFLFPMGQGDDLASREGTLPSLLGDNAKRKSGDSKKGRKRRERETQRLMLFRNAPITDAQPYYSDSFYVPMFVQRYLALDPEDCMRRIRDGAAWTDPADPDFKYRGHELPRQKAFWTRVDDNGQQDAALRLDAPPDPLRKYRYPGFQYGSMLSYRPLQAVPLVQQLTDALQDDLVLNGARIHVNHVIGTRYRDGDDYISFHADKVDDMTEGAPILSLSFGETRELHVIRSDSPDKPDVFKLGPGDLFVLGYQTNLTHKHAIMPVTREQKVEPRISLVFRNIRTVVPLAEVRAKAAKTRAIRENRQSETSSGGRNAPTKRAKTADDKNEGSH